MDLQGSTSKKIDHAQLDALMESVGWTPGRGEKKWEEILSKSSFVYSVYDGDTLVGFGRAVDDGAMCVFYDILVHANYQGKGIGKMVTQHLLDYTKDKNFIAVSLFAWPKNKDFLIPFYRKFGFELFETAMRLKK